MARHGAASASPAAQLIRRSHPLSLAHSGPDTGTHYCVDRLAAGIKPIIETLVAHRASFDVDRLAAGIRPAVEAFAAASCLRGPALPQRCRRPPSQDHHPQPHPPARAA
ncbi:hypothetical protein [Streptomyces sp. NPDC048644]|uniref:hypothetical protein n=1 Tax=Streptomyces sp. NPDC048644 TaxID=3365582 RepID=UPI00371E3E22